MPEHSSLRALREKKDGKFRVWMKRHCPFLFHWDSLFYFALFSIVVAIGWSIIYLFDNNGTMLFNWDYTSQNVPLAMNYWDMWHTFFKTGQFPLYDYVTMIGTDGIGSNNFYGIFDPFLFWMNFFPRDWIPWLFVIATYLKIMVSSLFMRHYLKIMGCKEWTARFGALAFGFCGYMNFMVGFTNVCSGIVFLPLILAGIENIIQKQKPGTLIVALFFQGLISFFFLIVFCIWGVLYALWRLFTSLSSRTRGENVKVLLMGICAFALGILMTSFAWLPSVRESSLTGRGSSIGMAYLHSIINSIKENDMTKFLGLLFEEVGDEPGRELMGLVSFFYPSTSFLYLPLVIRSSSQTYDCWTASIFCYTPIIILFFQAILTSIYEKKWHHMVGILLGCFLTFTNFAYFFFFAFSGNGYGRWLVVLVPSIIAYACYGFDHREAMPKWSMFASTVIAFAGTLITYWLIDQLLAGKVFSNPNGLTYFGGTASYYSTGDIFYGENRVYFLIIQCCFLAVEGVLLILKTKAKWLPKAMTLAIATEAIVTGCISADWNSTSGYWYMGGWSNFSTSEKLSDDIDAKNESDYGNGLARVYFDTNTGAANFWAAVGSKGSGSFNSLMNFDANDFYLMNRMVTAHGKGTTYGGEETYSPSWSGFYASKRLGGDLAMGYRYYVIQNNYKSWTHWLGENVPFGSEIVEEYEANNKVYRIYRVADGYCANLGHAVDSSLFYSIGHDDEERPYHSAFFHNNAQSTLAGYKELVYDQELFLKGALFDDGITLPDGFSLQEAPSTFDLSDFGLSILNFKTDFTASIYETDPWIKDYILPLPSSSYFDEGLGYFLNHYTSMTPITKTGSQSILRDSGRIVLSPSSGTYFNDSYEGCYFEFSMPRSYGDATEFPRVFVLGDTEDGKTNQTLCFEADSFRQSNSFFKGSDRTFGLYARGGRAKYIVLDWSGSALSEDGERNEITFNPSDVRMICRDYAELKQDVYDPLASSSLQNVKGYPNSYTFDTDYDASSYPNGRFVVTQLGYDKGWSCVATKENGEKIDCPMYKLDGGLVGFLAPSGKASYVLSYKTPYLDAGVSAAALALTVYFIYAGWCFYQDVKHLSKLGEVPLQDEKKRS